MLNNKVLKMISFVVSMICITVIVVTTKNTALMWWYLLPVIMLGVNIDTKNNNDKE